MEDWGERIENCNLMDHVMMSEEQCTVDNNGGPHVRRTV